MAIPDYQSIMLPVLRLAADGETRVPDAAKKLADQLGLSVAEREEMLPSGRQRIFHNRIHWAKFYMTKAGLIDSPACGRFVASQAGRALLATNPAGINVDTLKTYPAFAEFYASSTSDAGSTDAASTGAGETIDATTSATPEEQIDAAQAVLHQALKADLLQRILAQSPAFFERAIVDLLVGMGYGGSHENAARRLGKSGDGGIDGVIDEDRLDFSRPGKPTDNSYIESFNGKFRAECLNAHWFMSLDDARAKMEDWRRDYDEFRPHSAIGNKVPISLMNGSSAPAPTLATTPENSSSGWPKIGEYVNKTAGANSKLDKTWGQGHEQRPIFADKLAYFADPEFREMFDPVPQS